jgi:hypothetical protein
MVYAPANVLAFVLLVGIWSGILATIVYFAIRRSPSRPRTLGRRVLRFCVIAPIAAYATFVCVALVYTLVLNRADALAPGGIYVCTRTHEKVGCVQNNATVSSMAQASFMITAPSGKVFAPSHIVLSFLYRDGTGTYHTGGNDPFRPSLTCRNISGHDPRRTLIPAGTTTYGWPLSDLYCDDGMIPGGHYRINVHVKIDGGDDVLLHPADFTYQPR